MRKKEYELEKIFLDEDIKSIEKKINTFHELEEMKIDVFSEIRKEFETALEYMKELKQKKSIMYEIYNKNVWNDTRTEILNKLQEKVDYFTDKCKNFVNSKDRILNEDIISDYEFMIKLIEDYRITLRQEKTRKSFFRQYYLDE